MEQQFDNASILYCGHSTVIINTESGKRIIIDPWLEGNPRCPEELINCGKIDYICLTHGHSDHTGSALRLAKEHNAIIFATFELAILLAKDSVPETQLQPMNKGGTVNIPDGAGLSVSLTHALHSSSYDALDGKTYYSGEACGVVLTLESGRSIYHAGDTCLFSDMNLIQQQFRPDVALLPIGDRFTMGPIEAAAATKILGAEIVIPIHYATFDLLTGTAEEFSTAVEHQKTKISVVALAPGESFSL